MTPERRHDIKRLTTLSLQASDSPCMEGRPMLRDDVAWLLARLETAERERDALRVELAGAMGSLRFLRGDS